MFRIFQSACSLNGYGSFRAGVIKGLNDGQDIKTSTTLRNVDNWVKTLEDTPVALPQPHQEDAPDGREVLETVQRSPSPKPLTNTPPLSGYIHKPLPKAPLASPTMPLVPNGTIPNYENQLEYNKQVSKPNANLSTFGTPKFQTDTNTPTGNDSEQPKKAQQFSLKAWLKREREQVRRDVENDTSNGQKLQSPARSFTKMFQKLGGSSNKKQIDIPKRNKDTSKKLTTPPVKPMRQNYVQEISAPYAVVHKEIVSENNVLIAKEIPSDKIVDTPRRMLNNDRNLTEPVISPIDDNDEEIGNTDQSINMYNPYSPKTGETFGIPKSDMNNNESNRLNSSVQRSLQIKADITPLQNTGNLELHESNAISNSPGYYLNEHGTSHQREDSILTPDSDRVLAQKIPVYKAKIINNYENQGKFEIVHAVRQQAEPLNPKDAYRQKHREPNEHDKYGSDKVKSPYSHESQTPFDTPQSFHTPQSSQQTPFQTPQTSPFTTQQKFVKNNPTPPSHKVQNGHNPTPPSHKVQSGHRGSSRQNIERKRDVAKRGHFSNERDTPYSSACDRINDSSRYTTRENRETSNVRSIGSLIDRFDKQNNNTNQIQGGSDPNVQVETAKQDLLSPKPLTMTSTPVVHRKEMSGNLEEINEISPPLPPRTDRLKLKHAETSDLQKTLQNSPYTSKYLPSVNTPVQYYESYHQHQSHGENQNPYQFNSPSSFSSPQTQSDVPKNFHSPSTYSYGPPKDTEHSNHVNNNVISTTSYAPNANSEFINDNERGDSYSIQLRRAANHSAFDRYGQAKFPPYQARPGPHYPSPSSLAVVRPNVQDQDGISYMEI